MYYFQNLAMVTLVFIFNLTSEFLRIILLRKKVKRCYGKVKIWYSHSEKKFEPKYFDTVIKSVPDLQFFLTNSFLQSL